MKTNLQNLLGKTFFLTAFLLLPLTAQAQWQQIKLHIQPEVTILTENPERLVLRHTILGDTLWIAPEPREAADIYADIEWQRGGNPYQVWVAAPHFWTNATRPREMWGGYFKDDFLKILRPPPGYDEANPPPMPARELSSSHFGSQDR